MNFVQDIAKQALRPNVEPSKHNGIGSPKIALKLKFSMDIE